MAAVSIAFNDFASPAARCVFRASGGGTSANRRFPSAPEGLVAEESDDLRGQPCTKARRDTHRASVRYIVANLRSLRCWP